jgi:arylformamidase
MTNRTTVDLSQTIHPDMPTNRPDHFPPRITPYAAIDPDGWAGSTITIDSHCGTHVDAPSHFVAGGATLAEIPLDILIGACTRASVPASADDEPIAAAAVGELTAPRLLLHTGWSDRLEDDPDAYFAHHSYLSAELAHRLVDEGVVLVGIDGPSVDANDSDEVHQILLGAGVVIIENLANTASLPDTFEVAALPLPIRGGDGSPARVVALLDADEA